MSPAAPHPASHSAGRPADRPTDHSIDHPADRPATCSTTPPLITAIIPTYRRAAMVRSAVETVLAQRYAPLEVIVIDDNTDAHEQRAVRAALAGLGDNVTILPNARSKGACGARNTGILHARGTFIAFLDDDDRWLPGKLDAQLALFERMPCVATFCAYIDVDVAFNHARRCRATEPRLTRRHMLGGACPSSTSLLLVKTSVLIEAGLFDETLPSFQDFDMWLRCLAFGDFGYVDEPLVTFVQHTGTRTSVDLGRRMAGLAAIERKWGAEIGTHTDLAAFKRRVAVDALIANGKARLDTNYFAALGFFARALVTDRLSRRTAFWFAIGLLGSQWGKALYTRLLSVRHIETVPINV